ncbi:MAG TPA: LysE family translocator [Hyphomicrobiaceae bacterium]|nr:LysE family translocator [Hyphomicrobiaceae bacterium]
MPLDLLFALFAFAVVTCFTPGPNNLMLMTSGLNFGFERTLAHVLGVGIGFSVMLLAMGFGIAGLFTLYPVLYTVLRGVCIVYLLWLAWRIATAGPVGDGEVRGRPMTFLEAAAFQWVNPKGWAIALSAIATYIAADRLTMSVLIIAAMFGVVGFGSAATWALFGTTLRRVLRNPRAVRGFNIAMALLLVASLVPILTDTWN